MLQKMEHGPIVMSHLIFNGQQYSQWKTRMSKEICLTLECSKVLEPIPDGETDVERVARETQENQAAGAVFNKLGTDVINLVRDCNTVREIFAVLNLQYGAGNRVNALIIQSQLDNMRLDPQSDVI